MISKDQDVLDALKPGHRLHEYRIEKVLGHGGFGITYLAYDVLLDAPFAIKEFLPPDLAARGEGSSVVVRASSMRERFSWAKKKFLAEARVLARFRHPNLVRVSRIFEDNGTVYFVMDFVAGGTLDAWLKRHPEPDEAQVRGMLEALASGLAEVHAADTLHRDVKPGNIIVQEDNTPILIDFGAARQSYGAATRSVLNVVTAGYAPLEQYSEDGEQGPWTDIYALGAVGYRMVCGLKPLDAVNRLREDPMAPASRAAAGRYSPSLLQAIDWALGVHPEDRPGSVTQWLEAFAGAPAIDAPAPPKASARPASPSSRTPPAAPPESPRAPPRVAHEAVVVAAPGGDRRTGPLLAVFGLLALALGAWFLWPQERTGADATASAAAGAQVDAQVLELIAEGEAQLAAGSLSAIENLIRARIADNPDDPAALILRGHLAFTRGQRPAGIADYAIALAAEPGLSGNRQVARNLVSALSWNTNMAEGVIRNHASEALFNALAAEAVTSGARSRAHARRLLNELGQGQRLDALAFARAELEDPQNCEARIEAVLTIGQLGDPSDIPRLRAQKSDPKARGCLRGEVDKAIERIEGQTTRD